MAARVSGVLAAILLAACSTAAREAEIRDVRPLQIERDDKVIVEMNGALLAVGEPAAVSLDALPGMILPARVVAPNRALFDASAALEQLVATRTAGSGHLMLSTTVTITQLVGGQPRAFKSAAGDPFPLDLFPRTLHKAARGVADRVAGSGRLWSWLGVTVADSEKGGVLVTELVSRFDREAFFRTYDRAPLDGRVTRDEAKRAAMPDDLFARLDRNGDGVITESASPLGWELVKLPQGDGLAAVAGLAVGDLITSADGTPVHSTAELAAAWQGEAAAVSLQVTRAGKPVTLELPRHGRPTELPAWILFALAMLLVATAIALPVPVIGGLIVVWERKISAYMQSRIGPNRVGPGGWLQWLADGLKLIMKEDLVPAEADPILFKASPYLAFVGLFLVFMVLPFTQWLIAADLNIGLLFLLSVTSLVVVSIIMGGWSSNSKWSLLGGMRSAAQIISYELPASVALLSVATLSGSLSMQAIVQAQGGAPWSWFLFRSPFTFCAFFIYFISALAEGNRTPFDLPEAESELVSGYNTEYSGFRFSLFPLVEWVNLFVIGAVAATLFCGGWRIPLVSLATQDASGWLQLAGFLVFLLKILFFIFVIIWIRWTLPRFRVDQMMNLCWKYFIPLSFVCFLGTLILVWVLPYYADRALSVATFLVGGVVPAVIFLRKVRYNRSRYQELNLNPLL